MYKWPASRGHAFPRLIAKQPHARLTKGFLSWVATFFLREWNQHSSISVATVARAK